MFQHLKCDLSHSEIQNALKKIVGDDCVVTDPNELKSLGTDWTKVFTPDPLCCVFPKTTDEVSLILKYCSANQIPVVPSGGRTGLCAGAVAAKKEVVLSLSKMREILEVDLVGMSISVEAGVTTEAVQNAAKEAGMFFGVDLAAKGSSQIGGNIATNAGGVKLIRFGGMREQVLGLEVVLASGEVVNMLTGLRKNNSGYDLKQLFIGSEGTLGIVTKAVLKLVQKPREPEVSVMAVKRFEDIPKVIEVANRVGVCLTAFEFFTDVAHKIVLKRMLGTKSPFAEMAPFYILIEIEKTTEEASMQPLLEALLEEELIYDAVVATSSLQFKELWGLRENITESLSAHGHVRKNDISLALNKLSPFMSELKILLDAESLGDIEVVLFGHIGDGNLHINYVTPKDKDFKAFHARAREIEEKIFNLLKSFEGSISAEHGIGLTKKEDLHYSRTASEVTWMKKIKKEFDPVGILNPGKIFDFEN